jgi:hypothetical protein
VPTEENQGNTGVVVSTIPMDRDGRGLPEVAVRYITDGCFANFSETRSNSRFYRIDCLIGGFEPPSP